MDPDPPEENEEVEENGRERLGNVVLIPRKKDVR